MIVEKYRIKQQLPFSKRTDSSLIQVLYVIQIKVCLSFTDKERERRCSILSSREKKTKTYQCICKEEELINNVLYDQQNRRGALCLARGLICLWVVTWHDMMIRTRWSTEICKSSCWSVIYWGLHDSPLILAHVYPISAF